MDAGDRQERMGRIARHLEAAFGAIAGQTISFYGPFRGEPDPRDLMARVVTAGGRVALPVVLARASWGSATTRPRSRRSSPRSTTSRWTRS